MNRSTAQLSRNQGLTAEAQRTQRLEAFRQRKILRDLCASAVGFFSRKPRRAALVVQGGARAAIEYRGQIYLFIHFGPTTPLRSTHMTQTVTPSQYRYRRSTMTKSTKLILFSLYALLPLTMAACYDKQAGAAVSPSGSAPSSPAAVAAPPPAAPRPAGPPHG